MNVNISVIIPAYNAAKTLSQTLKSLRQQTCPDWEAIIVDDGSEDDTAAIAHQAATQDSRIRIVSRPNGGVSVARNTGAQLAKYAWLLFLDADDQIAATYIAKMAAKIEQNTLIDAVYCGWVRVAPDGSQSDEKYAPAPADLPSALAYYNPFAIHACVVEEAVFRRANGFDTSLKTCEEWDLWQRIARQGARFENVSEVLAYYYMREQSLSSDGSQVFTDGLRVLKQGHAPDPRVSNPHPDYADGLSTGRPSSLQVSSLQFRWSPWPAGFVIGLGKDASHLLRQLEGNAPSLAPHEIAASLFESVPLPTCCPPTKWWRLWDSVCQPLQTFLNSLEKTSETQGLAQRVITILERKIFENAVDAPLPMQIGHTYGVVLEVTQPIVNIIPPTGIERLYGFVTIEGQPLGTLELPVCDGQVSQLVLKDCIAAQFYWQILGHFYEEVHYHQPSQADTGVGGRSLHSQIGWTTFLQDLWDRPNWSQADFYNTSRLDGSSGTLQLETDELVLEVSRPLPNIKVSSTDLRVVLTAGGIAVSQFVVPTNAGEVSAQGLRAILTLAGGVELCRISVREAYIGQSIIQPETIRQRLETLSQQRAEIKTTAQATRSNLILEADDEVIHTLVLGQRHQSLGSSCSRWAYLPAEAAEDMSAMAKAIEETITYSPDSHHPIERLIYAPDALSFTQTGQFQKADWNSPESATVQTSFNNRDHFETLFAAQPDPWKYTSPYEQTKYEQTLSLLPNQRLRALELACAEGHFTAQLAPCVKSLIATDISQIAVERTAQKCAQFSHVHCQRLDMVADTLPGKFELVVCSEVLYYAGGWEGLQSTAQKIANALEPSGYFLTAHANLVVDEPDRPGYNWDYPFGAKGISDTFQRVKSLRLVKELWTPLYRIQLFQKSARNWLFWREHSPILIELPQPTPPPDTVAAHVLWEGGETVKWNMQPAATEQLPILMYHRIAPDGAEALKQWRTSPEAFAEQLRYLRDAGYYSVSLETWGEAITHKQPLPGRAIILTFDDGYLDFLTYAYPILQEYGFSATVFLVSDQVGKSNQWDTAYGERVPLMDWLQIRQLQAQGIEFGSHTATHQPLTALSAAEVVREGARSRTLITQELGIPVQTVAYPYGDTDLVVQHLIGACGYTVGVSCQSGHSCFKDSPLSLPRIEIAGSDSLDAFVRKLSKS